MSGAWSFLHNHKSVRRQDLTCICKASACITPAHISLMKANHTDKPRVSKVGKYTSPQLGERRE